MVQRARLILRFWFSVGSVASVVPRKELKVLPFVQLADANTALYRLENVLRTQKLPT